MRVALINEKLVTVALHPGHRVPGTSGLSQPSQVPTSQPDDLLATFNSAFRMKDANGGYWQNGRSVAALRRGAASMVSYKDDHLHVVRWNSATAGPNVAAVRQNLHGLVDHGLVDPDVDTTTAATWGVIIGNTTYVWRSAVGVRADGSVVFVAGAAMSGRTTANIAHDAEVLRVREPNPYHYLQPSSRDVVADLARGR